MIASHPAIEIQITKDDNLVFDTLPTVRALDHGDSMVIFGLGEMGRAPALQQIQAALRAGVGGLDMFTFITTWVSIERRRERAH